MWNPEDPEPNYTSHRPSRGETRDSPAARYPVHVPPDVTSRLTMSRSRCSVFMLTGVAMATGAVTLVTLALAVGTDYWLFMSEPYRMTPEEMAFWNLTEPLETNLLVYLRSGLWRVCTTNHNGSIPDQCLIIDYTQKGTGRLEGAPTCMTLVGAYRIATPLPVAALILALAAVTMSAVGSLRQNNKTIAAAVLFILSGLCLAVGVILFISAISDELGYQKKSLLKDFRYTYGWSFYTAGSAFISAEVAAVLCVTLYLRHHARVRDMMEIIPGLEDKIVADTIKLKHQKERPASADELQEVFW